MLKSHKLFSQILQESLRTKYKKVPAASIFANEFNFRAHGSDTITRETARKWLLGLSLPRPEKLSILVKWLNINIQEIYNQASREIIQIQDDAFEEITNTYQDLSGHSRATLLSYAKFLKYMEDSKDI